MTAAAQCFVFLPFSSLSWHLATPALSKKPLSYLATFLFLIWSRGSAHSSHNSWSGFSLVNTKFRFLLTQKVDILSTWNYSVFRTFGLLAAVDGRFHLHDRITEFLQRQDFQFSALIVYHCQMTWDIAWCFFYRPRGLYSCSSFHYFSSLLLLIHTHSRQSAGSIFGWFFSFFCCL